MSAESPAAVLRSVGFDRRRAAGVDLAQQLATIKGGNLFIRRAAVPAEIAPGGTVDVEATVSNGALFISATDPDACQNSATPCSFNDVGYCYELVVDPSWTSEKSVGPRCIQTTSVGTEDHHPTFVFTAPQQEGEYSITFELRGSNSGESASITRGITVTGDAPSRPPPPDENGDDGTDPETLIAGLTGLLIVTALVLLLGRIA